MTEEYFSQSNAHERTHSLCTVCWEQSTEGSRYKDVCTTCDKENIRQRVDKATEGPWFPQESSVISDNANTYNWRGRTKEVCALNDGEYIENQNDENDANFIANARQDIPHLLDEISRMERTISAAQTKLSAISSVLLVAQRAGGQISAETIMPLVDGALEELRKDDDDG